MPPYPKKHNKSAKSAKSSHNKTHKKFAKSHKNKIVKTFLEMLNIIKLYHWHTHSFAEHKATDELYEHLNTNIDKFVEVLLGKDQSRVNLVSLRIDLLEAETTKDIKNKIHEYRAFLIDLTRLFDAKRDSDLLNIRDEILADLNQFLYLLSFK